MQKEDDLLRSHLMDLADACDRRNQLTYSDFLNLNEQSLFLSMTSLLPSVTYTLDGGYPMAERKRIIFSPTGVEDLVSTPLCVLRAEPKNKKFSDALTHRDYLGALLNLGIVRGKLGDLLPDDEGCSIICAKEMQDYIKENFNRVKHTCVTCFQSEQDAFLYEPSYREIKGSVASFRLDSVIGLVFHGSRTKMTELIKQDKVFVNGKQISSNSYLLTEGDIVSVRGFGKFVFDGMQNHTKKGRCFVTVRLFC